MHQKQSCDYLQDDFIDEGGRKIQIYKIYKEKKKEGEAEYPEREGLI